MKRVLLSITLILSLLFFTACETEEIPLGTDTESTENLQTEKETEPETEEETVDPAIQEVNPENIQVLSAEGLNEQIYLTLGKIENGNYVVSYKAADAEEYTRVDKELILEEEESVACYILGLKEGDYSVRVECGSGDTFARVTLDNINVERQDRSGYAHFNLEEGIGGYNNDGTVKENAKILYVSNATKNTVTLDINGTTYTGLAYILPATEQMTEPLIIRVLDTITTNQWIPAVSRPEFDSSVSLEEYMESIISKEYGENLAGLRLSLGEHGEFTTVADGIGQMWDLEKPENYNWSYAWDNTIATWNAKNITVEGVGANAGFYQIGLAFMYCDSVEIKNLTFNQYLVDALSFFSYGQTLLHGRYWIHNNTFYDGYSEDEESWPGYNSDESIDFAEIKDVTISYNKFVAQDKCILIGGWEKDYQQNITLHHNHYLNIGQRTPLVRNANVHSYNNYFDNCGAGISPRMSAYFFSEGNYFNHMENSYYLSGEEAWGVIKSWNDKYFRSNGGKRNAEIVKDREEYVENNCMPDKVTDYSKFDTDPTLFYYDAENKCSDVELLHTAEEVPEFVPVYAGAGILTKLELDN